MQSDLSCCCGSLTPVEIELMWETAPARQGHPTTRNRAPSARQSLSIELPTPSRMAQATGHPNHGPVTL
jgi:hypothetical protein